MLAQSGFLSMYEIQVGSVRLLRCTEHRARDGMAPVYGVVYPVLLLMLNTNKYIDSHA